MYKLGDTFNQSFSTSEPDTGARKDAQSTPTGTLRRNGSDTGETVTVSSQTATGHYDATGTIPAGWSVGDRIELLIEATVQESDDSTNRTANMIIDMGVIDKRVSDLNDLSAADVNAEVDTALADYDPPTKAELDTAQSSIEADIAALNDFDPASDTVQNVDTVATLTGHTPQTGDVYAELPTNFSDLAITTPAGEVTAENMRGTDNASTHSAGDAADAVWDEAQGDHTIDNSFGDRVQTATLNTAGNNAKLATLGARFVGITSLPEWLGLIAGKQTGNSTARTELRGTGAGSGTYDETTDSLEAQQEELAKVPRKGAGAFRHRQTASDSGNSSADVVVEDAS